MSEAAMDNEQPPNTNQQDLPTEFDVFRGHGDTAPDEKQQGAVGTLDYFYAFPVYKRALTIMFEYSQIQPGDMVLDAGCGVGLYARDLAKRVGERGQVIGVELNQYMLEIARERAADDAVQPDYRIGDIQALAFDDGTFDVVWCMHTMEWVSDAQQAIDELIRVLKPGGRLVCKSIDWESSVNGRGDPEANDITVAASAQQFSNPHIARMFPKHFRDRGLQNIAVHAELIFSSPELLAATDGDGLANFDFALERGIITAEQHQYIRAEAEAAHRTRSNFDYKVMPIVAGTKPEE